MYNLNLTVLCLYIKNSKRGIYVSKFSINGFTHKPGMKKANCWVCMEYSSTPEHATSVSLLPFPSPCFRYPPEAPSTVSPPHPVSASLEQHVESQRTSRQKEES
ncbi:hypothetical protein V8G54_019436 [Vigna mungo]|uniref:Uncharacterized protein n=1 Tax=Vigna mungo TaxID=3915 RepID=A0AAQ3N9Z4_VIGMU